MKELEKEMRNSGELKGKNGEKREDGGKKSNIKLMLNEGTIKIWGNRK